MRDCSGGIGLPPKVQAAPELAAVGAISESLITASRSVTISPTVSLISILNEPVLLPQNSRENSKIMGSPTCRVLVEHCAHGRKPAGGGFSTKQLVDTVKGPSP